MKTKLGISCLVLALGAAVALVAWRAGDGGDRRRAAPGASEIEDEIATLRQEVERLKNQPRVVLAAGAVTAPAAGAPAVQDVPPAEAVGTLQGEEEDARASESAEAAARALDQHLEGDGRDQPWGQQIAGVITGSLATALPGSRLLDVRCGSTFCRLEVAHTTLREQRDLAQNMLDLPPVGGEAFYRYDRTSGSLRTAIYLARPDHRLPQVKYN